MSRLFRRLSLLFALCLFGTGVARAQFADCSTGLLQMPTAEMQPDGTFMITNNYLNKHALASRRWGYDTFQYGFSFSLWNRFEIGYVCTIINDHWKGSQSRPGVWMVNQDRHFTGRVALLREGDFGLGWMPGLVVGISDPVTASTNYEYATADMSAAGNGYFNRNFVVMTKHFGTPWGQLGVHGGYQYNRRSDYSINGPCFGLDWKPVWLQDLRFLHSVDCVLEYDSRTFNAGLLVSVWDDRFTAMVEWQSCRWLNFGLRYKLHIKK